MRKYFPYYCCLLFLAGFLSCQKEKGGSETPPPVNPPDTVVTDLTTLTYTVEAASDWTSLFKRTSGWIGGDGIYSIPLDGVDSMGAAKNNQTLFLFSDTQTGEIDTGVLSPGAVMIHNTVATLSGNQPDPEGIHFYWKVTGDSKPDAVFHPDGPYSLPEDYYWLGDGFVNQSNSNELTILAYKIQAVNSGFGFAIGGSTMITIPAGEQPPFTQAVQTETPLFVQGSSPDSNYAFGAGNFVNTKAAGAPVPDGYVYVYGVKNLPGLLNKGLMVARVTPAEFKDFSKWRFWDGTDWSLTVVDIRKAAVITDRVSDELSLSPLPDGRYILVFQQDVWGPVAIRIAATPHGPFGPVIPIWDCKEALTGKNYFAYNAKGHPSLSGPGELLISFNVNSFDYLKDIQSDPNLYRPRFIRLTFL